MRDTQKEKRGCFESHLPAGSNYQQSKWREMSTQCRKGPVALQRPPFMNNETVRGWLVQGNSVGDGEGEKLSH